MHVSMSQRLRDQIARNVDRLFENRYTDHNHLPESYGFSKQQVTEKLYAAAIPAVEEALMEQLGEKYFNRENSNEYYFSVNVLTPERDYDENTAIRVKQWLNDPENTLDRGVNAQVRIQVDIKGKYRNPKWQSYGAQSISYVTMKASCPDLLDAIQKFNDDEYRVRREHETFKRGIVKALQDSNSVKQFLTKWPAGENLLPSDVLAKHHQKAPPRANSKAAQLDEEQLTELNSIYLKAKILNS